MRVLKELGPVEEGNRARWTVKDNAGVEVVVDTLGETSRKPTSNSKASLCGKRNVLFILPHADVCCLKNLR